MTFRQKMNDSVTALRRARKLSPVLIFALIFAVLILLHLPLLSLPYHWDEGGYFVPAARDILLTFDFIPKSTLTNAHPPLVMAYLALCWKLFGYIPEVTRVAMLAVASFALLGIFSLARRVANHAVAVATVICTALYPVFFTQSSLAHLDMTAAAFTIWGLLLYLPARATTARLRSGTANEAALKTPGVRWVGCLIMFALAGLAKETAVLTPLALLGWELFCWWRGRKRATTPAYCLAPRHHVGWSFTLLLALLPLALWFFYHYERTGYVFGNPEYFRYNVAATMNASRILQTGIQRIWQATTYMNLFLLTGAAALALISRPLLDADEQRKRIEIPTQLVFALIIVVYVLAFSFVGGAVLARYMLPVIPLVILICVSTLWRRVRFWRLVIGIVCAGFVLALLINPPHPFAWEDNLAYRDFVLTQRNAAQFLSAHYPRARVLTTWPGSDELRSPELGYTDKPLAVVSIEQFSSAEIQKALSEKRQFDVAFIFSSNHADDLSPETVAQLLGGQIVYREERRGRWAVIIEINSGGQ
jgi:4-amino-4-deoxy-L-arabinose transferase-like glycosyltransferase